MEKLTTNIDPAIVRVLDIWLRPSSELTPSIPATHLAILASIQEYLTGALVSLPITEADEIEQIRGMLGGLMYIKSDLTHFVIREGCDR